VSYILKLEATSPSGIHIVQFQVAWKHWILYILVLLQVTSCGPVVVGCFLCDMAAEAIGVRDKELEDFRTDIATNLYAQYLTSHVHSYKHIQLACMGYCVQHGSL